MIIGFTGTQKDINNSQKELLLNLLKKYNPIEVHHGDCIGADLEFHKLVVEHFPNCKVVIHPPINKEKWARAVSMMMPTFYEIENPDEYLIRNHNIVDRSDVLIACPKQHNEVVRSGTWATIRYARKQNKIINIIKP